VSGIVVVAEHLRGALRDVTAELVSAGRELKASAGGPLAVAVIARDTAGLADALALEGVDEVIEVPVDRDEFDAVRYLQAVEQLLAERAPRLVLGGFTVNGMGYGAGVAARAGAGFASDVVAVTVEGDEIIATREFFGAKVQAELEFPGKDCVLLLLRPTVWAPAVPAGSPARSAFTPALNASRLRVEHREFLEAPRAEIDITNADVILAIGRGVGERDNIGQFEELAERMGATLASSRPLVDAGWLPQARQVGQSGHTVKPRVYLAFGISGAVQHLAGMKGAGTIVAVNTDQEAAIFNVAQLGAVADMFDVAEELEKLF
jgi:electron transfer flavoprotein alpha subunit